MGSGSSGLSVWTLQTAGDRMENDSANWPDMFFRLYAWISCLFKCSPAIKIPIKCLSLLKVFDKSSHAKLPKVLVSRPSSSPVANDVVVSTRMVLSVQLMTEYVAGSASEAEENMDQKEPSINNFGTLLAISRQWVSKRSLLSKLIPRS